MECNIHRGSEAITTCIQCGAPVCPLCASETNQVHLCYNCYRQRVEELAAQLAPASSIAIKQRRKAEAKVKPPKEKRVRKGKVPETAPPPPAGFPPPTTPAVEEEAYVIPEPTAPAPGAVESMRAETPPPPAPGAEISEAPLFVTPPSPPEAATPTYGPPPAAPAITPTAEAPPLSKKELARMKKEEQRRKLEEERRRKQEAKELKKSLKKAKKGKPVTAAPTVEIPPGPPAYHPEIPSTPSMPVSPEITPTVPLAEPAEFQPEIGSPPPQPAAPQYYEQLGAIETAPPPMEPTPQPITEPFIVGPVEPERPTEEEKGERPEDQGLSEGFFE